MRRALRLAAFLAALFLPAGTARAAFELGDASPGSLGAAAPEGPRQWLVADAPGAPPQGFVLALHRASLFQAPDLYADGATLWLSGTRAAAEFEVEQVSAGVARERSLRLRLQESAGRAVGIGVAVERLDLSVAGAPGRGGWAIGVGAFGRARVRGGDFGVVAAADRAMRSRSLAGLGVAASLRIEASCTAAGATVTLADRWGADGGHRPRLSLEIPLGGMARLRVGRSARPAAAGLALAVRAGPWELGVGRLEDPDGSSIVSAEIAIHRAARGDRTARTAPTRQADWSPSASLWGVGASATIPLSRQIRGFDAARQSTTPRDPEATAASDSLGVPGESGRFIPDPAVELSAPESLDDPDGSARAGATLSANAKGDPLWRAWWRTRTLFAVVAVHDSEARGGVVLSRGGIRIGGGALAAPSMGLVGERARLTRAERGAAVTRTPREAVRPTSGAGVDVDGVAIAWWPAANRDPSLSARVLLGARTRLRGEIAAGEIRVSRGVGSAASVRAAAWREAPAAAGTGVLGARWEHRGDAGGVGVEIARDAAGTHADLGILVRRGALSSSARWRHRAGVSRPGGLDIEAGWRVTRAGARLRWRSWSTRGAADDGRTELDLRAGRGGPGSWRLRLGATPEGSRGGAGERLALGEIVAARERGRTLRLSGSWRAAPVADGWRHGRALGASLSLRRGNRAALDLRVEAIRVERHAAAASGSFEIASEGSVRMRARGGVRLAARGWVARGAWRLGAAIDDEDTTETTTARATRARLWLTWNAAGGTL